MPSILETQRIIIERLERLEFGGGCCPDNVDIIGDGVDTDLTPGEGDPPASWGDEPVEDWDEWYQLLCGASYAYVAFLANSAREMQALISAGAWTIAIIAAILGLMSGAGLLLVISYGTAAAGFNAFVQLAGTAVFSEAADAIEANADEIVCAVLEDNLRIKMQDILPPLSWIFYQIVQWESATNTLWEGGVPGSSNLPVPGPTDCPDCGESPYPPPQDNNWNRTNVTSGHCLASDVDIQAAHTGCSWLHIDGKLSKGGSTGPYLVTFSRTVENSGPNARVRARMVAGSGSGSYPWFLRHNGSGNARIVPNDGTWSDWTSPATLTGLSFKYEVAYFNSCPREMNDIHFEIQSEDVDLSGCDV